MTAPLFFFKQLEEAVRASSEIPLWGSSPSFPWEACSENLAACLHLEGLTVSHQKTHFLLPNAFTAGLGNHSICTTIHLSPLSEPLYWLIAAEDVAELTQVLLSPENSMKSWGSSQFQQGFYRYLLLTCIEQIDQLKPFQDLSLKLGAPSPLPEEGSLCIDVHIAHPKLSCSCRLICPPSFLAHFKQHFASCTPSLLTAPLAQQIPLRLRVEIGHTELPASRFAKWSVGDLLILDRCTYDPHTHKGSASLALSGKSLLRVKIREQSLKVIDFAFYHEETPMSEHHEDEIEEGSEEHLWATEEQKEHSIEETLSAEPISLRLSVEIARIDMPLQKLLQLQPGNTIDLPIHPEEGVYLVLNGKRIAHGELVKWGDMLGVKILKTS